MNSPLLKKIAKFNAASRHLNVVPGHENATHHLLKTISNYILFRRTVRYNESQKYEFFLIGLSAKHISCTTLPPVDHKLTIHHQMTTSIHTRPSPSPLTLVNVALDPVLGVVLDVPAEPVVELSVGVEQRGHDEVQQRPELGHRVLDRRARQQDTAAAPETQQTLPALAGGGGTEGAWVRDQRVGRRGHRWHTGVGMALWYTFAF